MLKPCSLRPIFLAFALCAQVLAQISTASLAGVVQDSTQAVAPNIEIKITHIDTGRPFHTTSDSGGRYTFSALPVGRYKIIAGAAASVSLCYGKRAACDVTRPSPPTKFGRRRLRAWF